MQVFLIMELCDDPFYGWVPTGPAFASEEAAKKWITDKYASYGEDDRCETPYSIQMFEVQS